MMDFGTARRVLLDIAGVLDDLTIPFFLSHGTALGVYRDGGFTPQEDDIDLGFLAENFVPNSHRIVEALTRRGYELITLVRPFERCWAVKARKDGIGVDLVSFIRWQNQPHGDDGRLIPSTLADFCGYYPAPVFQQTQPIYVFGRWLSVPSPIEDYLQLEYGDDWQTPSGLHAYTTYSRTRIDGFLSSRGVPSDLLNGL